MQEAKFRSLGLQTPEPIHFNLARLITSTVRYDPHMQNMVAAEPVWGEHMGEIVRTLACFVFLHFLVPSNPRLSNAPTTRFPRRNL